MHPDPASVTLHNPLANGQANPGSWNALAVQTLECDEDFLMIFRVDADSIVCHRKLELGLSLTH